jgi:hypothetical protein
MALRDLQTNLKSLRYGKDRPGGGNSNQPYTTVSYNNSFDLDTADLGNTGGPDFTLRANTLQRTGKDASRISQFLFSSKGAQFVAKQNLLSRTGVKTQASGFVNGGIYLPTSTLSQVVANPFGTHLLKQGSNPYRDTSPNANPNNNNLLNLLGGSSLTAFLNNTGEVPVYSQVVKNDESPENNRLVNLKNSKISTNQPSSPQSFLNNLFGVQDFGEVLKALNPFKNKLGNVVKTIFTNNTKEFGISNFNDEILRYGGGPGSILGVGQTSIKRYYTTTTDGLEKDINTGFFNVLSSGIGIDGRYIGKSGTEAITDFRSNLPLDENTDRQNIISKSPDYSRKNIETRVNLGNPGKLNKNVSSYTKGLGRALDKINALPLYRSANVNPSPDVKDLIKFRIGVIDNANPRFKNYIHFRAFLDSMADNYSSTWNPETFMGRGEKFYRYGGFDRSISLAWTVAAQSKDELIPMYEKLNYLASVLSPDYTSAGYMAGNLVTLTVGDYIHEQTGFITGLNYGVPQESPWEIGINDAGGTDNTVRELPHMIKVTGFNFTPIHNFVPRVQQNQFNGEGKLTGFGNEKFIALENDANTKLESIINIDSTIVDTLPPVSQQLQNSTQGLNASDLLNR